MKIAPISGFPEWLPEQRLVELHFLDTLRAKFESFGYASVETRSVEPLEQLLRKGETDKEIYVLRRLQAEADEENKNLGLHFDLTVPFARYVAQFRHQLTFPFKRYQIQKVWRGERPKEGRYREFYQADIDVVAERNLPLAFDAEMPLLLHEVLSALPIPKVKLHIGHRKVLEGAYQSIGIEDAALAMRIADKLDKVGEAGIHKMLLEEAKLTSVQADACVALSRVRTEDVSFADQVRKLGLSGTLLDEGLSELTFVMEALKGLPAGSAVADLHIARGFDYYTGTIYEGVMEGHESLGAVCSGGRYDDLVAGGGEKLPGIGVSVGVSRILGRLLPKGQLTASRKTPTCVLVALQAEEGRDESQKVARALRSRGICTEVFHEPARMDKQIRYAERKGIPFVWFPLGLSGGHEVKDIRQGTQAAADVQSWAPPAEDARPLVQAVSPAAAPR